MTEFIRFTSKTCVPCKAQGKAIKAMQDGGSLTAKITAYDVEADFEMASKYKVRSVPTIIKLVKGSPVNQLNGNVSPEQLAAFLAA